MRLMPLVNIRNTTMTNVMNQSSFLLLPHRLPMTRIESKEIGDLGGSGGTDSKPVHLQLHSFIFGVGVE